MPVISLSCHNSGHFCIFAQYRQHLKGCNYNVLLNVHSKPRGQMPLLLCLSPGRWDSGRWGGSFLKVTCLSGVIPRPQGSKASALCPRCQQEGAQPETLSAAQSLWVDYPSGILILSWKKPKNSYSSLSVPWEVMWPTSSERHLRVSLLEASGNAFSFIIKGEGEAHKLCFLTALIP